MRGVEEPGPGALGEDGDVVPAVGLAVAGRGSRVLEAVLLDLDRGELPGEVHAGGAAAAVRGVEVLEPLCKRYKDNNLFKKTHIFLIISTLPFRLRS